MKLSFAILAVLAFCGTLEVNAVPVGNGSQRVTRNLKDDLTDFLALVPVDKIKDLFYQYLSEDEDFGEALDYVMSDEFKTLLTEIEAQSEVKELLKFLQESGLDAYGFLNKIHEILGLEHAKPSYFKFAKITGGLPGFIADVKALLPIKEIEKLYKEKLQNSKDFAALVERLQSAEFQGLIDKIMANSKLQDLIKRAEAKGVNVQAILDFLTSLLGLKFPSRPMVFQTLSLKDDLTDFLALIPIEEVKELFYQYLSEDEDFGEALDYVMSDEFKTLLTEIEAQSEVKKLLKFLQDSGLDAYGFLNKIHEILGLEHVKPSYFKFAKITGGLPGFIADVKALLPIKEIEKLYKEKLQNSKDFAALVERLQSAEFQGLVDKIMANSKLQDLIKRAEAKGVNVQAILDFLTSLLGLKFPSRPMVFQTLSLKDDLTDFLALIPIEEVKELFYQYLSEDEDFGEALDYVMSDEFKTLLTEIEAQSEVKKLLKFLQDSGLDAYGFLNKIHEILGLEHVKPSYFKFAKITGGLPGFIADVKALLPIKEIEKLYKEKLQNSKDFAALVERLQSAEFQGLVDKIMANSKLQDLIKRAEAKGVNVQAILDFLTSLLGLKFPSRPMVFQTLSLKDDLTDFLALIPIEEVKELFYQYLSEDEDFGEALDYVMSDEFKTLLTEIEAQSEVKKLLKFLQDSGLDAYGFLNKIHEILGLEHIKPSYFKFAKITGGLPGFIADVKALLPIKEIEKLYKEKLQNSKDFAALVERLQSSEFQGLVDKIMANSKLQDLIKRAEAKGVNVQAILDFLTSLLGLKFPSRPMVFQTLSLKDDLNDFLALIPIEEVKELFYIYLSEDEDFGATLDYVMSDEFKSLVVEIEAEPEVKELTKYLHDSGLDAYGFVNKIHDILGLEHIKPSFFGSTKITGGLPGFIADVKALLPIEEIKKLYNEKLQNSKDFAALVERLQSSEFQGLIDKISANVRLQDLLKRAEARGINVQAVLDFVSHLLGLKFPSRPVYFTNADEEEVIDILRHIWSKVPMDDIMDVIVEYLVQDEDFKRVVKFMMNDEFKEILVDIEEIPEVKALLKYFHENGMDIYTWINELHGLIGLEKTLPLMANYKEITGGVRGLLQDIRAILPLDYLHGYYDLKMKTSTKFSQFIHRLETQELQNAVNALGKHHGFNTLLDRLEVLGVDWDIVVELLSAIIGIKFPERPY